jgi:hypothetical protein
MEAFTFRECRGTGGLEPPCPKLLNCMCLIYSDLAINFPRFVYPIRSTAIFLFHSGMLPSCYRKQQTACTFPHLPLLSPTSPSSMRTGEAGDGCE